MNIRVITADGTSVDREYKDGEYVYTEAPQGKKDTVSIEIRKYDKSRIIFSLGSYGGNCLVDAEALMSAVLFIRDHGRAIVDERAIEEGSLLVEEALNGNDAQKTNKRTGKAGKG